MNTRIDDVEAAHEVAGEIERIYGKESAAEIIEAADCWPDDPGDVRKNQYSWKEYIDEEHEEALEIDLRRLQIQRHRLERGLNRARSRA